MTITLDLPEDLTGWLDTEASRRGEDRSRFAVSALDAARRDALQIAHDNGGESADNATPLDAGEIAAVQEALGELEAGKGVALGEFARNFEARFAARFDPLQTATKTSTTQ